jgi:hypothetical protein
VKQVKIKSQLFILFIPFVNALILPIWAFINLRNMHNLSYHKELFISLLFMSLSFIVGIPLLVLHKAIATPNGSFLATYELIMYYVWSTVAMALLVIYQKKKGVE